MNKSEFDFIELLARWWNTLNSWEWPIDLPGKPNEFDNSPKEKAFEEIISIQHRIESAIGMKECLRWHWVYHLEKTNSQFETWWEFKERNYET